jgi:MFS family permease
MTSTVDENQKKSLLTSSLTIMVVTHVLVHSAGNMRSTLFPVLKEEFSLSNQQIGLIVAIPSLIQIFFTVPTGYLSDRFGAKRMIAASIFLAAVGAFLGGISISPLMYIVASTLLTLNSTLYHPPSQSYVSNTTNSKDRSKALGIWNAGGTTGVALGPLSITILMGVFAFQWRQVYFFWTVPILLGLVAIYFMKPAEEIVVSETQEEEGQVEKLLNKDMMVFLFSGTVRMFGGGLTTGFLTIWLAESQGWSVSHIGLLFAASSLMGIVASPLGGELCSRFGDKRWLVWTLFVSYVCFALAITLKGRWLFSVFYLAQRFFGILGMPANMTMTAKLSPPKQRGVGFALSSIPNTAVGPLAAIIAAYIADYYGLYSIFITTTVIYFVGWLILQIGVKTE